MKYHNTKLGRAYNEDCFEVMKLMPDGCVDMILADLPYGTTACKWDTVIPFEPMWKEFHRIAKPNAAIVLTASQPFTTALVMSNIKNFRYSLVWDKTLGMGQNAKKMPIKSHEDIHLFYLRPPVYNPQMTVKEHKRPLPKQFKSEIMDLKSCKRDEAHHFSDNKYPVSIIKISSRSAECNPKHRQHPTQKPVALFEYLIRTYTNERAFVFDPTAGSLTTGVAAENLNRRWVCCEKEAEYFEKGVARFEA